MFLADFHVHSHFSDGKHSIRELVDAYGTRGFGAIAITDHLCEQHSALGVGARFLGKTLTPESFPAYVSVIKGEAERAWQQYRMVVIPGFELTQNYLSNHRSAHILGLGMREFVSADQDAVDLARAIRNAGGLSIAAHPVSTRKMEKQTLQLWNRREELRETFDAWEVASGPHLFDEVISERLPILANSDLHALKQMSSWKTVLECERHEGAILEAVRSQNLSVVFYADPVPARGDQVKKPLPFLT